MFTRRTVAAAAMAVALIGAVSVTDTAEANNCPGLPISSDDLIRVPVTIDEHPARLA